MIGWIVALGVALVAAFAIWTLSRRLDYARRDLDDARSAWHADQRQLQQQRPQAVVGGVLIDVQPALLAEQQRPRQRPGPLIDALAAYGTLVQAYDDAVRTCLQPVELMPGADGPDLDKLVEHVSAARRQLFQARSALIDNDSLQRMPELIDKALQREPGEPLARDLAVLAGAGRDASPVDPGALLQVLLRLTRVRHRQGPEVQAKVHDLPTLPPWPWLAPTVARLLQCGMRGAAPDAQARLAAAFVRGKVHIQFAAQRRYRVGSQHQAAINQAMQQLAQEIEHEGHQLRFDPDDTRSHGFTLVINAPGGRSD